MAMGFLWNRIRLLKTYVQYSAHIDLGSSRKSGVPTTVETSASSAEPQEGQNEIIVKGHGEQGLSYTVEPLICGQLIGHGRRLQQEQCPNSDSFLSRTPGIDFGGQGQRPSFSSKFPLVLHLNSPVPGPGAPKGFKARTLVKLYAFCLSHYLP
ncbi:predicted protein [Histoplasma capsulatum G186AR]|uniref:Uncharacterized protein n=1 Tax=Ajellomyces capsulatus (strain G186AR / H82 / ATCC MYA-2454 / RMSCC 2432) TaxID=447093 RepID=C0NMH8_AJECG|nr:uncharacterized protein HCBG_03955 [Histoplasma capsulatum G186AR]EEH07076.1 predicted protein [Histoplasma capsulatum G186AR]